MAVTSEHLPWLQLAVVPMASAPFLASSARAFSLLRQGFPSALPAACVSRSWPAWQTVAYRDQHGHAYYSPSLVRKGVLGLSQLRSLDSFPRCLPPTWVPRYSVAPAPSTTAGEFNQDLVRGWNTTPTLRVLMTASSVQERVPEDTWRPYVSRVSFGTSFVRHCGENSRLATGSLRGSRMPSAAPSVGPSKRIHMRSQHARIWLWPRVWCHVSCLSLR